MHTLFLLNPTAGKTDCTQQLPQQINAAAARAGLAPEEARVPHDACRRGLAV